MSSTRRKNIIWKIEKCSKQYALTVVRNAKFLSSLLKANQLDAKIASEKTSHKKVLAAEIETAAIEDSAEITTDSETTDQEKCTRQHALTVVKNVKYHSNRAATNQ